jgi:hypothetical protein
MSMRTLETILDPHLIPDLSVICRGCLEFDVSLDAILKDDNVARDYLEFDKHAKARYLKLLSKQGDIERLQMRREQFHETFGEDPEDFGRNSSDSRTDRPEMPLKRGMGCRAVRCRTSGRNRKAEL